jgi:hypothetical protein
MVLSGRYHNSWSFFVGQSARQRGYVHQNSLVAEQRLMRCLYRPNPQGRDALRCAGASVHEGRVDRRWPSANANADTGPPVRLPAIRRRFGLSTASHPSGPRGDGHEATGEVFARTAIQPYPPVALAGDDAETIVLDLVQPLAAGRQLRGLCRKARRDEPRRQVTLQHAPIVKDYSRASQPFYRVRLRRR